MAIPKYLQNKKYQDYGTRRAQDIVQGLVPTSAAEIAAQNTTPIWALPVGTQAVLGTAAAGAKALPSIGSRSSRERIDDLVRQLNAGSAGVRQISSSAIPDIGADVFAPQKTGTNISALVNAASVGAGGQAATPKAEIQNDALSFARPETADKRTLQDGEVAGNIWETMNEVVPIGDALVAADKKKAHRQTMQQGELAAVVAAMPKNVGQMNSERAEGLRREIEAKTPESVGGEQKAYGQGAQSYLNDEELNTYAWLWDNYSRRVADAWLDNIDTEARRQEYVERDRALLESDDLNAFQKAVIRGRSSALNVAYNMAGAVPYATETVGQQFRNASTGKDEAVSTESLASQLQQYSKENAETMTTGASEAEALLWSTGTSIANNLANYALFGPMGSTATLGMMATQAGASQAYDIGQRGGTGSQQLAGGVWAGVAEALGERVSLKGLEDIVTSPMARTSVKQIGAKVAAQMGIEFTEEAATEAMNILGDSLVMKDKAELAQFYAEYLKNNPGAEDKAALMTAVEGLKQIFEAGAQGALSGGFFGGMGVADTLPNMRNWEQQTEAAGSNATQSGPTSPQMGFVNGQMVEVAQPASALERLKESITQAAVPSSPRMEAQAQSGGIEGGLEQNPAQAQSGTGGRPVFDENAGDYILQDRDGNSIPRQQLIDEYQAATNKRLGNLSPFNPEFDKNMRQSRVPVKTVSVKPLALPEGTRPKSLPGIVVENLKNLFTGTKTNRETGYDIIVGKEGLKETANNAMRQGNPESVKALGGIQQLVENAILVGQAETVPDPSGTKKRNNPHRLYQLLFAAPYNDGGGTKVAKMRVDVMNDFNPANPQQRFYNLQSLEIENATGAHGATSAAADALATPVFKTRPGSVATLTIADLYRAVNGQNRQNNGGNAANSVDAEGIDAQPAVTGKSRDIQARQENALMRSVGDIFGIANREQRAVMGERMAAVVDEVRAVGYASEGTKQAFVDAVAEVATQAVDEAGYSEARDALAAFEGEVANLARYDADREQRSMQKEATATAVSRRAAILDGDVKAVEQAYSEAKKLKRVVDKAMRETALTAVEQTYVEDLLKGLRRVEDTIPAGMNAGGIRRVYEAKLPLRDTLAPVDELKARKRSELTEQAMGDLEGSEGWQDAKKGLKLALNTPERNFEAVIPDAATAQKLIDKYITPIHKAEADIKRENMAVVKEIEQLKLNRYESAYLHMEGDRRGVEAARGMGLERSDAEAAHLEKVTKEYRDQNAQKIDMAKIEKGIKIFRGIFEARHAQMNAELVRMGREPVPYRAGYWPHFSSDTADTPLAQIAKTLGLEYNRDGLPTDKAGRTHMFRPASRWNPHAKERSGFETEYNALEAMDRYLDLSGDIIHHTENIMQLRALSDAIRTKHSEDGVKETLAAIREDMTLDEDQRDVKLKELNQGHLSNFVQELEDRANILAGKKSSMDRTVERLLGRGFYSATKKLWGRIGANMVSVNPSTWATQMIPVMQASAEVRATSWAKAGYDTIKNYLKNDGLVDQSSMLTGRKNVDRLARSGVDKVGDILSSPMQMIDEFAAGWVFRSRYNDNIADGMGHQRALSDADAWTAKMMGARTKGAMPSIFYSQNPVIKPFTMFQLEVKNQLDHYIKDLPRDQKERGKGMGALIMVLVKYMIGAYVFNDAFEKVFGRRAALDPLGMVNDIFGDATGYQMPNAFDAVMSLARGEGVDFTTEKKGMGETIWDGAMSVAEQVPFIGGVLGGGRIPVQSALPDVEKIVKEAAGAAEGGNSPQRMWSEIFKELSKPLFYIVPPFGGGQLKKSWEAGKVLAEGESYTYDKDGNKRQRYAVENPNLGQALQMLTFGQYANPSAQEYAEGGFKIKSARYTAAYERALQSGVSGDAFRQWWATQEGIGPIKDEDGNVLESEKQQIIEAVRNVDATDEQRLILLEGVIKDFDQEIAGAQYAGVGADVVLDWWDVSTHIAPVKDDDGKTLESKRAQMMEAVQQYDIPPEQQLNLLWGADKELREQMDPAIQAGVGAADIMRWWDVKVNLATVKDAEGNVTESKIEQALNTVQQYNLTASQKLTLLRAADSSYDVSEKLEASHAAGVSDEVLLDWWQKSKTIEPDYYTAEDGTQKTIDNTERAKLMQAALEYGLTGEQTMALLEDSMHPSTYENLAENMSGSRAAGIPDSVALQWWAQEGLVRGEKNAKGNTIASSRQWNLVDLAQTLPLTAEQRYMLLEQAGVNMAKLGLYY